MTFQQDYKKILGLATKNIKEKKLRIDPEDLVNSAYIKFIESGSDYKYSQIAKYIARFAFAELEHQSAFKGEDFKGADKRESKTCKQCKEDKPIAAFYIHIIQNIPVPSSRCKECLCTNKRVGNSKINSSTIKLVESTAKSLRYTVNGVSVLISKTDKDLFNLHKWNLIPARQKEKKYYLACYLNNKTTYLHRLITKAPKGMVVDHLDGNPLNCQRDNLRVVTQSQNCLNRAVHRSAWT